MNDKHCRACKYCGMDMDMTPYCAHPIVLKRMPHGASLTSISAPTKSGGECTDKQLWEAHA